MKADLNRLAFIRLRRSVVVAACAHAGFALMPSYGGATEIEVIEHRDIEYATLGGQRLLLDLYLPSDATPPYPVILYVKGGAFKQYDRRDTAQQWIVDHGYAFASIDHRLSPTHHFPAQLEDCKAAVRWLRANSETYDIDPVRIGAWGSSSGGHLVNLLGTTGTTEEFDVGNHLEHSSAVQAVCSSHGSSDLRAFVEQRGISFEDSSNALAQFLGGPIGARQGQVVRANPITYVDSTTPPFLLIHGERDDIVPIEQARMLHDALRAAGRDVILHTSESGGHCYDLDTNLTDEVRRAREELVRFFDSRLKSMGRSGGR